MLKNIFYTIQNGENCYLLHCNIVYDEDNKICSYEKSQSMVKSDRSRKMYVLPNKVGRIFYKNIDYDIKGNTVLDLGSVNGAYHDIYLNGEKVKPYSTVIHTINVGNHVYVSPVWEKDFTKTFLLPKEFLSNLEHEWFTQIHQYVDGTCVKRYPNVIEAAGHDKKYDQLVDFHKSCLDIQLHKGTFFRYHFYGLHAYHFLERDAIERDDLPIIFHKGNIRYEIPNIIELDKMLSDSNISRREHESPRSIPICTDDCKQTIYYKFYETEQSTVFDYAIYMANLAFDVLTGRVKYEIIPDISD